MLTAKEAKEQARKREATNFENNMNKVKEHVFSQIQYASYDSKYWVVFDRERFDFKYLDKVAAELKSLGYMCEKTDQVFRVSWE